MTTTTKVEVRPEDAQLALKRAKGLLHVWAPLVRAVARNPKLKVELTSTAPRTDGKTVWLRVPIELAFHEHHKSECGKWDEDLNQFVCPACSVELDCDMTLFHEVSHLLAGSFAPDNPDDELIALMQEVWPKASFDRMSLSIIPGTYGIEEGDARYSLVQRLAERFPDQWGFFAFNVVEDVYVNASITEARKGLVLIFRAAYEKMMREGILMPDGNYKIFNELHPFIQACAVWSLIASGQPEVTRYLDPDITAAVKASKELNLLADAIATAETVLDRFKISMRLLLELERLGYYAREPERDEDTDKPGEGGEPCEGGDPAEGEGEGDGTGGDSGEGESSGEAEGDPDGTSGDGGTPEGGVEVDTDKTDSPTTSPGEGSGDTDGAGEGKNDDGIEPDSDSSTSEAGGDDTHGDAADTSEAGDDDGDGSDGEGADAPTDDSRSAPTDGHGSIEDGGGGKVDHDAFPEEGEGGEVSLPTIEEARAAFEHLTGHDGFGDDEEMAEALGEPEADPTDYESKKVTDLVEASLSFDGKLDHIDGSLLSMSTEPFVGSRSLIGASAPKNSDYDLPVEVMAPAAQRMRLAFAANRKVGNERGLKSGPKLDAKTLGYRIPAGDDRIFSRRSIPKRRDWTVLIGLDVSGSTRGRELEVEKQVAIGIGDLLTQVGIPFTVYAHTGTSTHVGDRYGYQLIVAPLKGEHQLWKGDGRDNVRRLQSGAANLDGHTMQAYRKLLERQKGKDKLLLYFTDGAMPCENGVEEKEILIRECALLKAKGIHTVGVGIDCDDPRRYGLDTIEVNSVKDIPMLLAGIGDRLTRR